MRLDVFLPVRSLIPNICSKTDSIFSESSPYPRLEINQELPAQSNAKNSQATLHTWGVSHAITLDGTSDGRFEHFLSRVLLNFGQPSSISVLEKQFSVYNRP